MKSGVVVNAVATREGGALSILMQFLCNADPSLNYHVCISSREVKNVLPQKSFIYYYVIEGVMGWRRLFWDYIGIKFWAKNNHIFPEILISLNNTPVIQFPGVEQVVYLHQAIPITDVKWRFMSKDERLYWFYKNVYPFFMRGFFSGRVNYVCQAEWMRSKYAALLRVDVEKIKAFSPDFQSHGISGRKSETDRKVLVYPAAPLKYKNHKVIVRAAKIIKEKKPSEYRGLQIVFTIDRAESVELWDAVKESGVEDLFSFVGYVPHARLLELISSSFGVLFPSEIETIGLPILEAAALGKPVVVADKPYSQDLLHEYSGARFVKSDDSEQWCEEIFSLIEDACDYPAFSLNREGWDEFFAYIKKIIGESGHAVTR